MINRNEVLCCFNHICFQSNCCQDYSGAEKFTKKTCQMIDLSLDYQYCKAYKNGQKAQWKRESSDDKIQRWESFFK